MDNNSGTSRIDTATRVLAGVGAAAVLLYGSRFLLNFFGPTLPYAMRNEPWCELDSEEFLQFLSLVTDGAVRRSQLTRLKNGDEFYPQYLAAMATAKRSINLEFYEFLEGTIAGKVVAALTERAAAGVEVRVLVDAIGSFGTKDSYFDSLRKAGGQMQWYHPARWNTWQMLNNRSHRKVLVVDGTIGFIGGAGIADQWWQSTPKEPMWRDTVFRVEGEGVGGLISTFSENWLEASGELLSGSGQFGYPASCVGARGFVVLGTPHGGSTQNRILFQALIKSARKTIRITTPYFLPDRSARGALIEAVRRRGVSVEIVTAGPKIDHAFIRTASRNSSKYLLEAGAQIHEYQPAMIHAKTMTIDEQWVVVGSTNFDHRSFALNDEVNMAIHDRELASTLREDFEQDVRDSSPLTLATLRKRGPLEEVPEILASAIERES